MRVQEMASAQVEVVRRLWTQTGEAGDEEPGAREGGEKSHEKCDEVGFDVWVNQRLLAPTPPRRIKLLTWTEACAHLATLARHLLRVTVRKRALSSNPRQNSRHVTVLAWRMLWSRNGGTSGDFERSQRL
jgi:hypothetical protein